IYRSVAATPVDHDLDLQQAIALVLLAGKFERIIGIGFTKIARARYLHHPVSPEQLVHLRRRHAGIDVAPLQSPSITKCSGNQRKNCKSSHEEDAAGNHHLHQSESPAKAKSQKPNAHAQTPRAGGIAKFHRTPLRRFWRSASDKTEARPV